jgi:hypothetical protein
VEKAEKIGRVHDSIRRSRRRHSLNQDARALFGNAATLKTHLQREIGLSWSLDLSLLPQWGWPGGSPASIQFQTTPSLNWTALKGKRFGEGSVQISYITSRYLSGTTAADLAKAMGQLTAINDYPVNQDIFAQLSYTQAFPGDKILLTVGQYPFFNFDSNQYLANQQINFNSYIFSQNGSATYPNAGLGAYAQLNLSSQLQVAAGLQNASDIAGATLTTRDFGAGGYAWFAYGQWTPKFQGLGSSQYSFLYYAVPTVSSQSASHGWSVNAVQNLNNTWALFGRANQAADFLTPIRSSLALGAAMNNPLGRSATDQIGLAIGYSTASPPPSNPAGARNETVLEAYWSWTVLGGWLLTPSVQVVLDPAFAPDRTSSWTLSLRGAMMF